MRMKGTPSDQPMDVDPSKPAAIKSDPSIEIDSRWMNMDKVEHEKLAWMKDLPQPSVQRTADESVRSLTEVWLARLMVYSDCRIRKVFPLGSISRAISSLVQPIYQWQPLCIITAKNPMRLVTPWMNCSISLVPPSFNNVSLLCKPCRISFVKYARLIFAIEFNWQSIDLN